MKKNVQKGSEQAPEKFKIVIDVDGPYMVYGQPPLMIQTIIPDSEGVPWEFREGRSFTCKEDPTALCRCGESKSNPYCDGAHIHADWDPTLTASMEPLLKGAEVIEGPVVSLSDNEKYCAFARFCDAKGRVWNLTQMNSKEAVDLTIREANMCPAGRLSAWDNDTQTPHEPQYPPSLALIEDPAIRSSSALWVRGGIPIMKADGETYEIRNRVTLCRCGQSSNKPFCDGTHASIRFKDNLE